jgi:hypothetical protein
MLPMFASMFMGVVRLPPANLPPNGIKGEQIMMRTMQANTYPIPINPMQSYYLPAAVTPAQTGIDINSIMSTMLPMMMVAMMVKMMSSAVGGIGGKKKTKQAEIPVPAK